MPIYAYRCTACGHAKDVLQKVADPVLTVCPACGASAFAKQLTAAGFQLKGSGWYVTDFKGGGGAKKPADAGNGDAVGATTDKPGESTPSDSTKADSSKSEPAKGEPTRSEPTRSEPTKSEPTRSEPTKREPTRSDPTKREPTQSEPTKRESSGKSGSGPAEPKKPAAAGTQ